MAENFFQERFQKNLKFYEGKTREELEKNYEQLYAGLDIKDVYLAELTIIKKLLTKEKTSKMGSETINFDEYIKNIDELYAKVENMDEADIEQNKEIIERIIVSVKLSLNSPIYFKVNPEELKNVNLNAEINEFIKNNQPKGQLIELKQFKEALNAEIVKKQKSIEQEKMKIRSTEPLDRLEELYWKLRTNEINISAFVIEVMQLNLTNVEQAAILEISQKIILYHDKRSIDQFDRKLSFLVHDFKKNNNDISAKIVDIERSISMLEKISQNIDEKGNFIQCISDELIDEYINQINLLNLNVIPLTQQILKEQSRIARKQRIEQIVRTIENRTKSLIRKKTQEEPKPKTEKSENVQLPNEYNDILDTAKTILSLLSNPNYNMELDELESIFVDELMNNNVNQNKIDETMKSASSEACRLKFIVHGLNYQMSNIEQKNLEKSINLIIYYIKCFNECLKKLEAEKDLERTFDKKISIMNDEITKTESQIEEEMLDHLDEEKIKNLDAYIKVDIENITEEDKEGIESALSALDLDITILKLYKSYKMLKDTISETKIFIEMINEEKSMDFLPQAEEKIKLISDLLKQYQESKRIYKEELKRKEIEELQVENDANNDENILVFFEQENGTIQAVERIKEDSKVYGSYKQSELEKVKHLLDYMKTATSEEIKSISVPIKSDLYPNVSFGFRAKLGGNIRLAYQQLSSSILGTEKPVYLITSIGKKETNTSDVYEDAISNIGRIDDFINKNYKTLLNATPEQKKEFLRKQKEIEEQITSALTKERGELHGTKK